MVESPRSVIPYRGTAWLHHDRRRPRGAGDVQRRDAFRRPPPGGERGGTIAIECGDERVTYARAAERVNRFGSALRDALDVRAGGTHRAAAARRPGVRLRASSARSRSARCRFRINTLWKPADYRYVLNDSRAARARRQRGAAAADRARFPRRSSRSLRHIVVVGAPTAAAAARSTAARRADRPSSTPSRPAATRRVLAVFVGQHRRAEGLRPPAARHGRVRGAVRPAACSASARADRCFSVAKLFFAYGLGNALLLPVRGRRDDASSGRARRRRERLRGDRAASADAVLLGADRLRDAARASHADGATSICRASGSPCRPARRCRRRSSSASSSASASTSSTASDRPRCCTSSSRTGRTRFVPARAACSCPATRRGLLDDDGDRSRRARSAICGSTAIRSAPCYWNQHEKTQEHDRGPLDSHRRQVHAGRRRLLLVRRPRRRHAQGRRLWVSPVEVENALIEHAAVLECGVVGREDRDGLSKPLAFVVLRERRIGDHRSWRRSCSSSCASALAEYKRPRWVEFVPALPKTATGKIQRFKLRSTGAEPCARSADRSGGSLRARCRPAPVRA